MTRHEQNHEQEVDERQVIRRLRASARDESATAEPPTGLLERLRADLPENLPANDADTADTAPPSRSPLASPWLRLAALLAVALVGGWMTFQLVERPQSGVTPTAEEREADERETARGETGRDRASGESSLPASSDGATTAQVEGDRRETRRPTAEDRAGSVEAGGVDATPPPPPEVEAEALMDSADAVAADQAAPHATAAPGTSAPQPVSPPVVEAEPPPPAPPSSRAAQKALEPQNRAVEPRRQPGLVQEEMVVPPSPPPSPPAESTVTGHALQESAPSPGSPPVNRQIEEHNARLEEMNREAAELERQLADLDAETGQSTVQPAPMPPPEPPAATVPPPHRWPVGPPPLTRTAADALSTFGLDVDTGSWSIARARLRHGRWPQSSMIRTEEILNVFDYHDPAPTAETFGVTAELAPAPAAITGQAGRHLLRLGVKARELAAVERRPAALTFVVDVSGSMDRPQRLPLLKRSLGMLLDQLEPGDTVALVAYNDHPRLLLPHTGDVGAVRRALMELAAGGSTNAAGGLQVGYREARRVFRPERVNRVILASDGIANVGATTPEAILERVGREAAEGIELTTLGFGVDSYNDRLMEQLADQGDGRYAYLDGLEEAHRVLVEELTGTLYTVAEEARVQVEMAPGVVRAWRLLGYDNRAIADERFRWESEDAGEIGAGHAMTVLYELELEPEVAASLPPSAALAVVRVRWREPGNGEWRESQHRVTGSVLAASWQDAGPALRFAGLAARFAEALRYGPHSDAAVSVPLLLPEARQLVNRHWPRDTERQELVELMERLVQLTTRPPGVVPVGVEPPRR